MLMSKEITGRSWRRSSALIVCIGLLTAGVIVLFQVMNLLVMYRYVRLDYYLCVVALFFLCLGLTLNKRRVLASCPADVAVIKIPAIDAAPVTVDRTTDVRCQLSSREWQVLKLVAEGKTNKEIAAVQFVELSTVKTHLNNIYGKLSVKNRKEARVRYAELAP